jgi:predicted TPR repeat methyltransferase
MPRIPGDAGPPEVTMPPAHFDNLYADKTDPWDFSASWYEQRKYALAIASLPRRRYRACLELGCSIGLMTNLLAQRCDHVTGIDSATRALDQARLTLGDVDHVSLRHAVLPDGLPDQRFDLIVASEVLYYFTSQDLTNLLDELINRLEPDWPDPEWLIQVE